MELGHHDEQELVADVHRDVHNRISTVFCTVGPASTSTARTPVHHSVDELEESHGEPPFCVADGDGQHIVELHRRFRPPFPPPHPGLLPLSSPTRRHHSLNQVSTRRVRAHGLKLPGEAQPISVRRCTYHHRHTPVLADPCGAPGTACRPAEAGTHLQNESRRPPRAAAPAPTQSQARHPRAP